MHCTLAKTHYIWLQAAKVLFDYLFTFWPENNFLCYVAASFPKTYKHIYTDYINKTASFFCIVMQNVCVLYPSLMVMKHAVKVIYHEHKLEWAYKSCWNTV